MARISQRAMNNVVIIAMLIMIALFNLDSLVPKKDVVQSRSLLPEDAYVLKIEHDGHSLERVGQQWRQSGQNTVLAIKPDVQFPIGNGQGLSRPLTYPKRLPTYSLISS